MLGSSPCHRQPTPNHWSLLRQFFARRAWSGECECACVCMCAPPSPAPPPCAEGKVRAQWGGKTSFQTSDGLLRSPAFQKPLCSVPADPLLGTDHGVYFQVDGRSSPICSLSFHFGPRGLCKLFSCPLKRVIAPHVGFHISKVINDGLFLVREGALLPSDRRVISGDEQGPHTPFLSLFVFPAEAPTQTLQGC